MIGAHDTHATYSMPANSGVGFSSDNILLWPFERIADELSSFIRTFRDADNIFTYKERLIENVKIGHLYLNVRLQDIAAERPNLHELINEKPLSVIGALEYGLLDAYYQSTYNKSANEIKSDSDEAVPGIQLLLSGGTAITTRQLDSRRMERLVTVSAIVVQMSRPVSKAKTLRIRCRNCDDVQNLNFDIAQEVLRLPNQCRSAANQGAGGVRVDKCPSDPYQIVHNECSFWDVQELKIQELPEHVPAGDMPRPVTIVCGRSLVNNALPGSRVNVVGVFTSSRKVVGREKGGGDSDIELRSSFFHVLGIHAETQLGGGVDGFKSDNSPEDIAQFQKFAASPEVLRRIVDSVAPSIFSRDDLKQAVACSLFSAPRKRLNDGTFIRGDINVLLLGDPGTAKSQLLKFAQRVAPISVFTSGKGASAAGLTAAITRDMNGNFALEGGAMVLADGGLVCIDEFDKMRGEDRVAIHEAMEQQTISIAKAGITTVLNSRCAVLAAANPTFGSFTGQGSASENSANDGAAGGNSTEHSFETTILSRFDMIFLVKDLRDKDRELALHVLKLHSQADKQSMSLAEDEEDRKASKKGALTADQLKAYIHYARNNCFPRLSDSAASSLENHYVSYRQQVAAAKRQGAIPITVRQLDAIERIAESLARMALEPQVLDSHVQAAIQLFQSSTMEAVKGGVEVQSLNMQDAKVIRAAENEILSIIPVSGRKSINVIHTELAKIGISKGVTAQALNQLIKRGVLSDKMLNVQRLKQF